MVIGDACSIGGGGAERIRIEGFGGREREREVQWEGGRKM